jgi:opacity protein-like surface antigen
MKKILMVVCAMMFSVASFAQVGKSTASVHFDYMIDSPNNVGIGANYGYEFAQNVRGVAEFNYFFAKDGVSAWNGNVNVEYLFHLANSSVTIYPLAGLNVLGWSGDASDSKMGLNIGAGVEVPLTSSVTFKAEYNYKTQYDGKSTLSVGLVFPL